MVFHRSNAVLGCQKYFRVLLRCMFFPIFCQVLLTSGKTLNVCHAIVVVVKYILVKIVFIHAVRR